MFHSINPGKVNITGCLFHDFVYHNYCSCLDKAVYPYSLMKFI